MKEKLRLDRDTGEFVSVLTKDGSEIPDPTPMAPPVGFIRQRPLHERIRAMVQHEFERRRQSEEVESPEEADDFEIPEDDAREYRFALQPGHEHEWEEHYEPPKDFKELKDRLLQAGWTPPQSSEEGREVAKQARAPSGGAPASEEVEREGVKAEKVKAEKVVVKKPPPPVW